MVNSSQVKNKMRYMNLSKRNAYMKTFVISNCSLFLMFHSRNLNHRIKNIHERALRVTNRGYKSTFLQQKDNSSTIHERKLQVLATEILRQKMICQVKL